MIVNSENEEKASAIRYSLVETARTNGLKVYAYLKFLDDLAPWSTTFQEKYRNSKLIK